MSHYLLLKPSGYYFRFHTPCDIRKIIGHKTELRSSLKTDLIREARPLAMIIAGRIKHLIQKIRAADNMTTQLTTNHIQYFIQKYIQETLEADEQDRLPDGIKRLPMEPHSTGFY